MMKCSNREAFAQLIEGLTATEPSTAIRLPGDFEIPCPPLALPGSLRSRLIAGLSSLLEKKFERRAVEACLGLDRNSP